MATLNKSKKALTDKTLTSIIEKTFEEKSISFEKGKVWTTDAFYRETPSAINYYIKKGAIAVEMECATWCIVANQLNLNFAQFLYFSFTKTRIALSSVMFFAKLLLFANHWLFQPLFTPILKPLGLIFCPILPPT